MIKQKNYKHKRKKDNNFYVASKKVNYHNKNYKQFCSRLKIKVIDNIITEVVLNYNLTNNTNISITNDEKFITRLICNYVRHNYTNYDKLIQQIDIKFICQSDIKKEVNKLIIKKYKLNKG